MNKKPQLSTPTVCPFCQTKLNWEEIKRNIESKCPNQICHEQYLICFYGSGDDGENESWDWSIQVRIHVNRYFWYSDGVFFINDDPQDYFPEITIKSIQTILNFS